MNRHPSGSPLELHTHNLPNLRKEGSTAQSANGLQRLVRGYTRTMADYLQTGIAVESGLGRSASSLTKTSDALLATAARNGEHIAYVELCRRHREMVFRTVLRITHNIDDAEDILQDSWMRAFTHIGTFDGRSAFSTWVTRIAINSALTTMRRRRTQRESSLDDPVDPDNRRVIEMVEPSRNPEEHCLETERLRLVRQAIKRLPSKLRTAIEIRQSQDGSMSELAMLAGVSVPTMKSRLVRARFRLREPLSKVLKGRSTSEVSQRATEGGSARRRLRRQDRSKDVVIARDHLSTRERSVHLNEVSATPDNGQDGHWVIDQRVACDLFSNAGAVDGQSTAN
jgi:RNA polymerase sigma factor (sigma-70 family)